MRYLVGKQGATLKRWRKTKDRYETQKNARWFRFLKKRPNHKHPERNRVYPYWEKVQAVFCDRFLCPEPMQEIRPEDANIETLLKQAFGVLETAAANTGFDVPGKKSFAPKNFHFETYADFERWMIRKLRTVAVQKPEWGIEVIPNAGPGTFDEEILDQYLKHRTLSEEYKRGLREDEAEDMQQELEAVGVFN